MPDIDFPFTTQNRDIAIAAPTIELSSQVNHYLAVNRGERELSPTYGRRSGLFQSIAAPGLIVAAERSGLNDFFPSTNFDVSVKEQGGGRIDVDIAIASNPGLG